MKSRRSLVRRGAAMLLLLLLFFTASQLASQLPGAVALRTSVHTLGLGDYSPDAGGRLAPLSLQILDEAKADSAGPAASPAPAATPTPTPRPTPTPTPRPKPTPTPTPPPTPTPTPTPLPTSGITGTVVDAGGGAPIAGARIQAAAAALTSSTTTDTTGGYTLKLLPGLYSVTASADGHVAQTQPVTVPVGTWVPVDFRLQPAPASIKGTVVSNLTGLGIAGATVTLSPGGLTTTTSGSGAFTFPTVTAGTYTLTASAAAYRSATTSVSVAPGQTLTLTVRLRTILGL